MLGEPLGEVRAPVVVRHKDVTRHLTGVAVTAASQEAVMAGAIDPKPDLI
jgi:hypothetical protein